MRRGVGCSYIGSPLERTKKKGTFLGPPVQSRLQEYWAGGGEMNRLLSPEKGPRQGCQAASLRQWAAHDWTTGRLAFLWPNFRVLESHARRLLALRAKPPRYFAKFEGLVQRRSLFWVGHPGWSEAGEGLICTSCCKGQTVGTDQPSRRQFRPTDPSGCGAVSFSTVLLLEST